jgi:hypothetical protein
MTPTTGIQLLLRLASIDPGFLVILRRDPQQAAATAEITLTRSESAILAALSPDTLERMVTRLPLPEPERRDFMRQVALGALGVLGVSAGASTS